MNVTLRFIAILLFCLAAENFSLTAKSCDAHFFLHNHKPQISDSQYFNSKTNFNCIELKNTQLGAKAIVSKKVLNNNEIILIRTAIVASPQYSEYFLNKQNAQSKNISEKKKLIKNELQKAIDEVNKVLSRDLNIKLELIPRIEELIFVEKNILFTHINNHYDALTVAEEVISNTINISDYDLGHIFTTENGGASGKNTAFSNNKWQGSTGASVPEGHKFYINYFAHEIGHQLGATHTQNADCARSHNSSVEIDSGISIMSYAGICSLKDSNIGASTAPFYHIFSIEQIQQHLNRYFTRNNLTKELNIVEIPNYTIPIGTPFELEIETSNSIKNIWYNCEQIDKDARNQKNVQFSQSGPAFISPKLSYSNILHFPPLLDVLNNQLYNTFNSLSDIPRSYNFAASVRANDIDGQYFDVNKFLINTKGNTSFKITSQDKAGINWSTGETYGITWNSDELKANGFNFDTVDISLSLDGLNFDYIIESKVPNTGNYNFTIPKGIQSDHCRIKVKVSDNIFYAINQAPFSINKNTTTRFSSDELGFLHDGKYIIPVNQEFNLKDIEVNIKLKEGIYEDLNIILTNPQGETRELFHLSCQTRLHNVDMTLLNYWYTQNTNAFDYNLCPDEITGNLPFKENMTIEKTDGYWQILISNKGETTMESLISWGIKFIGSGTKTTLPSLNKSAALNTTTLYPNPVSDILWLENNSFLQNKTYGNILNTQGKVIYEFVIDSTNKKSLDLSNFNKGIYFIQISNTKINETKKVVIR